MTQDQHALCFTSTLINTDTRRHLGTARDLQSNIHIFQQERPGGVVGFTIYRTRDSKDVGSNLTDELLLLGPLSMMFNS